MPDDIMFLPWARRGFARAISATKNTADRANAVRQILDAEGVPAGNIYMVAGKADTDPLFPDDPYMSPNRRVTITLMREEPPLPDNLTP